MEAKDDTPYLSMHRTVSTAKNDVTPNASSAEDETPAGAVCARQWLSVFSQEPLPKDSPRVQALKSLFSG